MNHKNALPALLLVSSLHATAVMAASLPANIVYERVGTVNTSVMFTDNFVIDTHGLYQATLTDFESPNALTESSLDVASGTGSLGKLSAPGSMTFEAGPGDYLVSLFAAVGAGISAEEKQKLIAEDLQRRSDEWRRSLTDEQLAARKALRATLSKEEKLAKREMRWEKAERRVDRQLESEQLGEYGIEIAMLGDAVDTLPPGENVSAVPLPAALWLFASGLLGLSGVARTSLRRRN